MKKNKKGYTPIYPHIFAMILSLLIYTFIEYRQDSFVENIKRIFMYIGFFCISILIVSIIMFIITNIELYRFNRLYKNKEKFKKVWNKLSLNKQRDYIYLS